MLSADTPLLPIAQVIKSYGTGGEIMVSVFPQWPEDFDETEPVFLYFEGLPVPFFIESLEFRGNRARLRLEGIDSLEAADELAGMKLHLPADRAGGDADEEELVGYTLQDTSGSIRGTISALHDFGGNVCLSVTAADGGEQLYPLHEDLIAGFDEERRILILEIPEGL